LVVRHYNIIVGIHEYYYVTSRLSKVLSRMRAQVFPRLRGSNPFGSIIIPRSRDPREVIIYLRVSETNFAWYYYYNIPMTSLILIDMVDKNGFCIARIQLCGGICTIILLLFRLYFFKIFFVGISRVYYAKFPNGLPSLDFFYKYNIPMGYRYS